MSLQFALSESFERSFTLYDDFVDGLDESVSKTRLPNLLSNTVGLQLWCVVGARESFSVAIRKNEWAGFSCSLETTTDKSSVADALTRSSAAVAEALKGAESYSNAQNRLIVDLLEHEASHQGQLIRYLYGLKLPIPESWKSRYHLS